jgi:hypothetical protein
VNAAGLFFRDSVESLLSKAGAKNKIKLC